MLNKVWSPTITVKKLTLILFTFLHLYWKIRKDQLEHRSSWYSNQSQYKTGTVMPNGRSWRIVFGDSRIVIFFCVCTWLIQRSLYCYPDKEIWRFVKNKDLNPHDCIHTWKKKTNLLSNGFYFHLKIQRCTHFPVIR